MKKRPTIALAMIVKNEAHNLPRLFASIEGCFDEVHITDTGSTDGTPDVARKLGAQVHEFQWVDDFAAARNASFEPVKTDFVMWLDGDDVLGNREAFIRWRDDAMEFADYWMATYHYSSDAAGRPNCSFARERVFRVEKGMRWRYFVHEGVIPQSPFGQIRPDYIPTWHVRHMRTEEDLVADRSRNLKIFAKNMDRLDARMKYYYGKELFENQNPLEAVRWFLDAVSDPTLEPHDRILGIQYACYAAMQCNQFERAIQLAYQGLALAPNRAEFYVIVGDCQVKLGRFIDSVPSYAAAKVCQNASPRGALVAGPIFTTEDAYTVYPRNQIAKVLAQLGLFEQARKEAVECQSAYNHPETQTIIQEIDKHLKLVKGNTNAKPCDDIAITCPPGPYEWDADLARQKGMGGSETAAIEMATWLRKLSGRPVKVFNMRQEPKTCDGVEYVPTSVAAAYFADHKPFAHIAWRHNFDLTDARTFLWAHDLVTPGAENAAKYEAMLCLTPFHKRYAMAKQGVPEEKIRVTRNGIRPERFDRAGTWPMKNPNKFVFPSSPDRGLDRAMRVLDRVREKHPDIELHVFYGFENLRKFGRGDLADRLEAMVRERPWVKFHGFTQQDRLIEHFKEAAIWLHPCDFIETSCITAMEMICAGVYPVTRRLGGLADTLSQAEAAGMATLLDHDCVTELEYESYIEATLKALEERAWERVSVDPTQHSWESVARSWLETFLSPASPAQAEMSAA